MTLPKIPVTFVRDDLSSEPTRALVARHLTGMRASSPPQTVHAFGGELKSMRVADAVLRQGVGRAMLDHLMDVAVRNGAMSRTIEWDARDALAAAQRITVAVRSLLP